MSFSAYPEYCASSIDYLGALPEHWWTVPLKRLATVRNGRDYKEVEEAAGPYPVIGSGGEFARASSQLYSGNSVLFGRKGTVDRPLLISGAFWTVDTMFYTEIHQNTDPRYLFYAGLIIPFGRISTNTALPSVAQEDLSETYLPQPPLAEQKVISDFLDHETARIDALIEEQQRLIRLLREKQQEVIGQAISRGLEAGATLEDCGVPYIGKIPSHWRLKRLWHLTPKHRQIMYGIVLPGPHFEGGIPIVKGGDVAEHRLRLNNLSRTDPEIERKYERSRLRTGDLVYSIRGSIGEAAKIPAELDGANLTQDAARIAYTDATDGDWLLYALQANPIFRQLESKAVGATIRGINIRDLKRALIPTPPLSEQREIANLLKEKLSEFQRLEDEAKRAISLMTEHRASLISSAVTGKIDVREWNHSTPSTEEALPQVAEEEGRYG